MHAMPLPNTLAASSLKAVAKNYFILFTNLRNVRIGCHTPVCIATSFKMGNMKPNLNHNQIDGLEGFMILLCKDYRSFHINVGWKAVKQVSHLSQKCVFHYELLHKNLLFPDHSKFIQLDFLLVISASSCVSF
jgi:hypothetical protein